MPTEPENRDSPIEEVEWQWLRLHLERGALVIVAPGIDLEEAAGAIAADDVARVQSWIETGKVGKAALEQITTWNTEPGKRFRMAIVQPYVLVQEI